MNSNSVQKRPSYYTDTYPRILALLGDKREIKSRLVPSQTIGWLVNSRGNILLFFNIYCPGLHPTKHYLLGGMRDRDDNIWLNLIVRSGTGRENILKLKKILQSQPQY